VIAQNMNGTVTLTYTPPAPPALVVGQWYRGRIRGINNGVSALNGEVIVQARTATTLVSKEVIGIPTAQAGGFIRVYKQVQPFVDYGDITLNGEVGKHKRGRPFGSTPGRARRRIRG
jgi:hypothetical protein